MKFIFYVLILLICSNSAFALRCESMFTSEISPEISPEISNRPLLNSLKRIRNYETFNSILMTDTKTNRMVLVVFDVYDDGIIGERKSVDDHVKELRSFASEIRYVHNDLTQQQILLSRLIKDRDAKKNENLLNAKFESQINIFENLKKSETIKESFEHEVFQAVQNWTSNTGPNLNVLILPESLRNSFIENAANAKTYQFQTLDTAIQVIDPINSI